jgi:hypothetical protein
MNETSDTAQLQIENRGTPLSGGWPTFTFFVKVGTSCWRSQLFFAGTSKLAWCATNPSATTAAMICIHHLKLFSIKTDIGFTYDANGRMLTELQSTPDSCGYTYAGVTYNGPGVVISIPGIPGIPTIYYGGSGNSNLDGNGRPLSVTAYSGQNPVPMNGVVYTALGPTLGHLRIGRQRCLHLRWKHRTQRFT